MSTPAAPAAPAAPPAPPEARPEAPRGARRPYEAPAFVVSRAFERQALSCAGCLNQSASFPAFCAMRS
ncbi:MAG: hypothetical protein FJ138_03325 [Deltaproteobacteria bacterium]|nr:hypothetical protein [Deltaproteobacteria bacterium]